MLLLLLPLLPPELNLVWIIICSIWPIPHLAHAGPVLTWPARPTCGGMLSCVRIHYACSIVRRRALLVLLVSRVGLRGDRQAVFIQPPRLMV
jgi:hypothetical protein